MPVYTHPDDITPYDVEDYLKGSSKYDEEEILPEDQEIISRLIQHFTKGKQIETLKKRFYADIQNGEPLLLTEIGHADLYPALLINGIGKAFNTDHYHIELHDRIRASREILYRSLYGTQLTDMGLQESLWNKYRNYMEEQGGEWWHGRFNDLRKKGRIIDSSMSRTPANRYHAAFSFFGMDFNPDSLKVFKKNIKTYVESVKPGGLVAGALMGGATSWQMGKSAIPAVPLSVKDVQDAFKEAGAYVQVDKIKAPPGIRDGYDGVIMWSGFRKLN